MNLDSSQGGSHS